jgi:hypothetical protein
VARISGTMWQCADRVPFDFEYVKPRVEQGLREFEAGSSSSSLASDTTDVLAATLVVRWSALTPIFRLRRFQPPQSEEHYGSTMTY